MSLEHTDVNPGVLGPNIASARKRAGINQSELSRRIGVSRPILVAIESGERSPSPSVLANLSDALGIPVRDLITLPATDEAARVRFRDPLRSGDGAQDAVDALIEFGRHYVLLESKPGMRFRRRSMSPLALEDYSDLEAAAEHLAVTERARFNLGDGPLLDLRAVLEEDVGMLIFGLRQLAQTKIAGLFTFALDVPLVGFNVAQSDPRRQHWTLAHEYAHFLTNRYDAEITYENGGNYSRDRHEVFAEKFTSNFLMPATGLSRRFYELVGASQSATVAHIVMLADQFRVSFQAMCERLADLQHIPRHTYAHVMSQGFRPLEAERSMGIERKDERLAPYPVRYIYLLSRLHRQGALSDGDVARFLQTDRLSSREILESFDSDTEYPIDAPLEEAL